MIALCRAKVWIVQLKEDTTPLLPNTQKGVKGHCIIYPQDPGAIATKLPPSIVDVVTPITILFIGAEKPSQKWLQENAKPLAVRADRVRAALVWLVANNPLYRDVRINHSVLDEMSQLPFLPYHVEHIPSTDAQETLQARYDDNDIAAVDCDEHAETVFQNVVITDVDGHASPNELRAAAVRHFKADRGYLGIPHGHHPVNEFNNATLFPMMYPTLYPYGLGGMEDVRRVYPVSFKLHVRHLRSKPWPTAWSRVIWRPRETRRNGK
ncbi:hypothetical protein FPV67DRAFT_1569069 [Lyophyllum atratum]|nr:hypothetical protein FPV67DRAFT_1569069 [Lyophyllum atratum]